MEAESDRFRGAEDASEDPTPDREGVYFLTGETGLESFIFIKQLTSCAGLKL